MFNLDSLLEAVKNQIVSHVQGGNHSGFDTGGLLDKITDVFGRHKQAAGGEHVAPASEDPYGDPGAGNTNGRSVKPASQDPYGDPADPVGRAH